MNFKNYSSQWYISLLIYFLQIHSFVAFERNWNACLTLQSPSPTHPPLTLRFAQKIQSPSFSSAATSVEFAPCWIFFLYSMHNCVSLWNVPKFPKGIDPCIRWPISYPLKKIPETKVNKEDKLTSLLCWSGFQRRSQIPRGGLKESHSGLDAELWNATDMTDIPGCLFFSFQPKRKVFCVSYFLQATLCNFEGVVVFHVLGALKHRIAQNIAAYKIFLLKLEYQCAAALVTNGWSSNRSQSLPLTCASSKIWAEDKRTQDKW